MTAPLVPPEVDLRDFQFMPQDVARLRNSDFAALTSGDEFRAGILLTGAAWHQKPAGSLPDDDAVLSQLAGYGRVVKEWLTVRKGALRGWIKRDDGRLYHPVVAEKANEAWAQKLGYGWRKACDRIRKENASRKERGLPPLELPKSPTESPAKHASRPAFSTTVDGIPAERIEPSNGIPSEGVVVSDGIPAESALKGPDQTGVISSLRSDPASEGNSTAIAEAKSKIAPDDMPSERDTKAAQSAGVGPDAFWPEWANFLDDFRASGAVGRSYEWRARLARLAPQLAVSPHAEGNHPAPSPALDAVAISGAEGNHLPTACARPLALVAKPKPTPKTTRATSMSEDWRPTEHHFAVGAERGLSAAQVQNEADESKEFWIGDGRKKLDWNRTFTARLISRAPQILAQAARAGPRGSARDRDSEFINRMMGQSDEQTATFDDFRGTTIDVEPSRLS